MRDSDCVRLLRWALPRMEMRWEGFRKVRRQVCRRIDGRLRELGLSDVEQYRQLLLSDAREWSCLEPLCRVTISRFLRDRRIFEILREEVLPELARRSQAVDGGPLRAWSAGCASGEEPYSVALCVLHATPSCVREVGVEIIATDSDRQLLARARRGRYRASSLRELPEAWLQEDFLPLGEDLFELAPRIRRPVSFRLQDLRRETPAGGFDLVLCRNLAFTYYAVSLQRRVLERIADRIVAGGYLVIGSHEELPAPGPRLCPLRRGLPIYRRPL